VDMGVMLHAASVRQRAGMSLEAQGDEVVSSIRKK